MSQSILKSPNQAANLSHHGFDLSQNLKFSSTVGELLPVYRHFLNPNESISISVTMKTRTEPLKTPGFIDIEEVVDFFFVPISQLYKPFENIFYGIDNFQSDFYDTRNIPLANRVNDYFPHTCFKDLYDNFVASQIWTSSRWYSFYNGTTILDLGALRLMDRLGLPVSRFIGTEMTNTDPIVLWYALAYQKCFSDFYRLTDFTTNEPMSYNVDALYNGAASANISVEYLRKIFRLRYAPWKKDYFTNIFTSPYAPSYDGSVSSTGATSVSFFAGARDMLVQSRAPVLQYDGSYDQDRFTRIVPTDSGFTDSDSVSMTIDNYGGRIGSGFPVDAMETSRIDTMSLRAMFAMDKLLEVTRRAPKRYDSQTLAHFGVKPSQGINGEVIHIGRHVHNVMCDDVISTASTDNEPLGALAGKGYGASKSKTFKFSTKEHGILMAIYHARPIVDYYQQGFDKLDMCVRPGHYYIPEYDKLGNQPVYRGECYFTGSDKDAVVLGFDYRYSQFKTKYDLTSGKFMGVARNWTIARNFAVSAIYDTPQPSDLSYIQSAMYINPTSLDSVMEVQYDPDNVNINATSEINYSNLYETDPLLHHFFFDCKMSSTMSTYGLPDL